MDEKGFRRVLAEYREHLKNDRHNVRLHLKIGDIHLKLGEYEEAIAAYQAVGERYREEGALVKAYAVNKQIAGIIRRHRPDREELYREVAQKIADLNEELGLIENELPPLRPKLRLVQTSKETEDHAAGSKEAAASDRWALRMLENAIEADPTDAAKHQLAADYHLRLDETDGALPHLGKAAQILVDEGKAQDALDTLRRLLVIRKEPKYARLAAKIHLDRGGPDDADAALGVLTICFDVDRRDVEAWELARRASEAITSADDGQVHYDLGIAYAEMGLLDDAVQELEMALSKLDPKDPRVAAVQKQLKMIRSGSEPPPKPPPPVLH